MFECLIKLLVDIDGFLAAYMCSETCIEPVNPIIPWDEN